MKKLIVLLSFIALVLPAAQTNQPPQLPDVKRPRSYPVRFPLPPNAHYVTTDPNGEVNFWKRKPFVVIIDAPPGGVPRPVFWGDGDASVLQIVGGVKLPGDRWKRSARRVR